jgi:hypothetical protein
MFPVLPRVKNSASRRFFWPPREAIGKTQVRAERDSAGAEMSSDVIIGHDGKPRCGWAGAGDTALGVINDHVHGCFRATDYPTTARSH